MEATGNNQGKESVPQCDRASWKELRYGKVFTHLNFIIMNGFNRVFRTFIDRFLSTFFGVGVAHRCS